MQETRPCNTGFKTNLPRVYPFLKKILTNGRVQKRR